MLKLEFRSIYAVFKKTKKKNYVCIYQVDVGTCTFSFNHRQMFIRYFETVTCSFMNLKFLWDCRRYILSSEWPLSRNVIVYYDIREQPLPLHLYLIILSIVRLSNCSFPSPWASPRTSLFWLPTPDYLLLFLPCPINKSPNKSLWNS